MDTRRTYPTAVVARWLLAAILAAAVIFGCSKDDTVSNQTESLDGAALLGLATGRTLVYLRTDSARDSQFVLHVYETLDTVTVDGSGNDWTVAQRGEPTLSLKVTDQYVLQNGYWPVGIATSVDPVYFPTPPVLVSRHLDNGVLAGRYPAYRQGDVEQERLFLYSYFGFYFTRTFTGLTALTIPAGSFSAQSFEVQLFQGDINLDPLAIVHEYYVPGVGLVRLSFEAGAFKRDLSLVDYD